MTSLWRSIMLSGCLVLSFATASVAWNDRATALQEELLPSTNTETLDQLRIAKAVALERSLINEQLGASLDAFDCASRQQDPFGLPVHGQAVKVEFSAGKSLSDRSRSTLFNQALKKVKFVAVSPQRGEIFIGARRLKKGQSLVLRFQGEEVEAKLLELSGQTAVFEDVNGSTRLSLPLGIMPQLSPSEGGSHES